MVSFRWDASLGSFIEKGVAGVRAGTTSFITLGKGTCLDLNGSGSVTWTIPAISTDKLLVGIKGNGTCKIYSGSTSVTVTATTHFALQEIALVSSSQTSVKIEWISGHIYISDVILLYNEVTKKIDSFKSRYEIKSHLFEQKRNFLFNTDLYINDTLRDAKADGIVRTPEDWIKLTGSYKVGENADGTKYQECASNGTTAKASTQAYNIWEFALKKSGSASRVYIISGSGSISDSYLFFFGSDERVAFIGGSANIATAPNYIQENVHYRIKITRNSILNEYVTGAVGTFAIYIKGGSFGTEYVLVDVTGGSGTNPITENTYTTSEFFVADLDAGDKIGAVTMYK